MQQQVQHGDVHVSLAPCVNKVLLQQQWELYEPVTIGFRVGADIATAALEVVAPILGVVTDDLSFQLQQPLRVFQLEVLDVSSPVGVEEWRENLLFPFPNGYDQYKLSRSATLGQVVTAPLPMLRSSYEALPLKVQDALDWYIKALHAPFDADRFLFFWISVEILARLSSVSVQEPKRLRCQHIIATCPECHKPTSELRVGATNVAFLETLGLGRSDAERLWKTRQLVHGSTGFTPSSIAHLEEMLQMLRATAMLALKRALGIGDGQPPIAVLGGLTIRGGPAIGGMRQVVASDLWDQPPLGQ